MSGLLFTKNASYLSSLSQRIIRLGIVPSCVLGLLYSGELRGQRMEEGAGTLQAVQPAGETPEGNDAQEHWIGPGKVRFSMGEDGRWKEFEPAWTGGRSLISGGGVFVFCGDEVGTNGHFFRISAVESGRCYEGMPGGLRAPMPNPDDDGDGRVDEDRLDGVDNDRDGLVDEDFAAIGDDMLVCGDATAPAVDGPNLEFHEECYAWSLPNIDGMVMIRLAVKNTGTASVPDVRIGAFMRKSGPFTFTRKPVGTRVSGEPPSPAPSDALVCVEGGGTSMAMILFPAPQVPSDRGRWRGGYRYGESAGAGAPDETLFADMLRSTGDATGPSPGRDDARAADSGGTSVPGGALVYGISPVLGPLEPGSEVEITLALLSTPEERLLDPALINAYDTYIGDGEHRFLPPAVAMTPQILWGSYRTINDGEPGVLVSIDPVAGVPVGPGRISFLSGIDASDVGARTSPGAGTQLLIRGSFAQRATGGERLVLKGRLNSGEFFEALLRADGDATTPRSQPQQEAAAYWRTPGKLDEELLKGSPNPFRESTAIIYSVPSAIEQEDGTRLQFNSPLDISVKVYNVMGRLISVLVDERLGQGTYTTEWRAVDEMGNPVASGVYYVKLQIENKNITKRLILLK